MTTMNIANNGKVRQSLASEIDRLDRMLDGLSDGLNEAVADAVKAAVGTAVREAAQAVLTEVLTNPEICARLNGTLATATIGPAQPAVAKPSLRQRLRNLWQGVRSCVVRLCRSCGSTIRQLPTATWNLGCRIVRGLAGLWRQCQALNRIKYQLFTAVTVGTTVAVGAWFAGPHLSALISGVGGFTASLGVQGWLWVRKTLGFSPEQLA